MNLQIEPPFGHLTLGYNLDPKDFVITYTLTRNLSGQTY